MKGDQVYEAISGRPGIGRRSMMAAATVFCLLTLGFQATADGDTTDDLIRTGHELYQNRSYEEALAAYDQALLLSPDDLQAWMGKAKVLNALGDQNRSLLAYQNATRIDPDDQEAWFFVGLNRYLLQDLNESLKALERALEIDENYTRAWELKSAVLVQMGKNDGALEASRRARMTSTPSDTEMLSHSWVSESFVLRQMGRNDEALAALENATTIDPKNYDAWILLGEALQGRGEYNRSLAAYDSLLFNIAPTSPPMLALVLIDKGSVLMDTGRYEEARDLYQQTIYLNFSLDPLDQYYLGRAWLGEGVSLFWLGDYEGALEAFNRSMVAEPGLADDAWRGVGDARMGLGSYEEALQAYDMALEIYPEFVNAERGHAWKGRGDCLSVLGRNEDALLAYQNASLAYDLVIEMPDQARQAYPLNGEFWLNRGAVLEALGLEARVEEAYERARELGYETPSASSLVLTNVVSVGNDEFIEMTKDGTDTQTFENLTLTIDGGESILLPGFTLGPGERIRFHLGESESNETDIFLNSDLALDDVAGNLTLKNAAGTLDKFAAYWTPEATSEYWIEKGRQLLSAESYEDALDALNNATDVDFQNAMAWLSKAQILGPNLGRYNESLEACDKAIEINPENPDTWRLKGLILMNLGRDEEALAAFEEAIELDPQNGYALYLKGNLLQHLGRESEAEEAFARAQELGFTSPLEGMITITEIVATGEDEFVEIANNLDEAKDLEGWTLVVDEDETRSLVLPEYVLEPGEKVRVHFASGEDAGTTDLFMESEIVLNDDATCVTLRDEAGREVSFLGFENLPDGGVVGTRGSGFED